MQPKIAHQNPLAAIAYEIADFGRSDVDPTSLASLVTGASPFYSRWRDDVVNQVDVLTFGNPDDAATARLHRYQLVSGPKPEFNPATDTPIAIGEVQVLAMLKEYMYAHFIARGLRSSTEPTRLEEVV